MNVVVLKGVWWERSIVDETHPSGILVARTVKSRARAKLEESTGGWCWWVMGISSTGAGAGGEHRENAQVEVRCWGNTPRLSSACYSPSLDFPIARYPSVHFSQCNSPS